jgi:hypothetical protein
MPSPPGDLPEQAPIIDVTGARLVDLVRRNDPELVASIETLNALLGRSSEMRLGWASAIVYE